ncbi:hypothetical protein JCM10212_004159 [Sporobolomyces blumeae]
MPANRGKLLVRGSINVDEFFEVPHIVKSGETISSTTFSRRAGGKGANQAVSAAKAGASVELAATIGNDGIWLEEVLSPYGVSTSLLALDEELPTGRAIIQLSSSTADNSIVLLPGANFASTSTLPSPDDLASTYTHLLLQNEIPFDATRDALRRGKQAGLTTLWNPSPMPTTPALHAFEWESLDWLLINEGEGKDLVAALSQESESSVAPSTADSPEDVMRQLRQGRLGSLTGIIMTLGGEGAMASLRGSETLVRVPAGKLAGPVTDTTGAGDCLSGFFATLLSTVESSSTDTLRSGTLESILSIACQAAAMCVEKHGAMESMPTLKEVKERMGGDWSDGIDGQPWDVLLA